MKRRVGIIVMASLLTLCLWSLTGYSADDDDDKKTRKEAQEAVKKLVESINNNKADVQAQVAAIRKKYDMLEPLMWVYKPRNKGGVGWGKDGSGIEQEIGKLGSASSKIKLTPKKLADLKADLIKTGELSRAVAEIAEAYTDQFAKKNPAKWKEYCKDMKKSSDELIAAAKGGDAVKVKKAAGNLNESCTKCHSDFRE